MKLIPIDQPIVGQEEKNNLSEAIDSGWISSMGPFVTEFENAFAAYLGVNYARSCFSGTAAIDLLVPTLKLSAGDEIIIPTLTFSADAFALTRNGIKVVFADCGKDCFTLCVDDVRRKITRKTKAIFPTHLYGRPADIDSLMGICREHDLIFLEDCCQAQGAKYKERAVGTFGLYNVHSFHNKLIACGEGGMMTTNHEEVASRFDRLKSPASVNDFSHSEMSMNQRMSNLHCAVGLAQLNRLESVVEKKLRIARIYDEAFSNMDGVRVVPADSHCRSVYWRYTILLDERIDRKQLIADTRDLGFVTRETYRPMHLHAAYFDAEISLPNAEAIGRTGIDIPTSATLSDDDLQRVIDGIRMCVRKRLVA